MTVFLRDCSHYDTNTSLAGFAGATYKVTEGTSYVDPAAKARLNAWHDQGVTVLGSYHVLHTGNVQAQLDHWVSTLDSIAPWWRTFPHWVMQVDAERWPTDDVSASTVLAFARLLVDAGLPGWAVTYASRGQYGDSLSGIATPLWNAAYHSSTYPGDGAADWAPYSGRTPVLWQYTSTPYDKNAFRGSLDELLALIGGSDTMSTTTENQVAALWNAMFLGGSWCGDKATTPAVNAAHGSQGNSVFDQLRELRAHVGAATLSGAQYADLKAALVAAQPSAADVAAHVDVQALAAALASHIKVS